MGIAEILEIAGNLLVEHPLNREEIGSFIAFLKGGSKLDIDVDLDSVSSILQSTTASIGDISDHLEKARRQVQSAYAMEGTIFYKGWKSSQRKARRKDIDRITAILINIKMLLEAPRAEHIINNIKTVMIQLQPIFSSVPRGKAMSQLHIWHADLKKQLHAVTSSGTLARTVQIAEIEHDIRPGITYMLNPSDTFASIVFQRHVIENGPALKFYGPELHPDSFTFWKLLKDFQPIEPFVKANGSCDVRFVEVHRNTNFIIAVVIWAESPPRETPKVMRFNREIRLSRALAGVARQEVDLNLCKCRVIESGAPVRPKDGLITAVSSGLCLFRVDFACPYPD